MWLQAEMGHTSLSHVLEGGGEVEFQAAAAAEGSLPYFNMTSYNGGALRLRGQYWPVIFDLATTKAAPAVPILYGHDPDIVLGHNDYVNVLASKVKNSGPMSGVHPKVDEVKGSAKNGFPWQVSLGVESTRLEFVEAGATVKVNGKTFTGPVLVARDNTIRETSILPMGADATTSATLAAGYYNGGPAMFETWLTKKGFNPAELTATQRTTLQAQFDREQQEERERTNPPTPPTPPTPPGNNPPVPDPVVTMRAGAAAERSRIDSINSLAVEFGNPTMLGDDGRMRLHIASHAIEQGWSRDRTENAMLRAARPQVQSGGGPGENESANVLQLLQAALGQATNMPRDILESRFTPQQLQAAHTRFRSRIGLQEALFEAARANGYTGGSNVKVNLRDMLRAAFSTIDLGTAFTTNFNTFLMVGYNSVDTSWRKFTRIGRVSDFKEVTNLRFTGGFTFQKLAPDGHLEHATTAESTFGNKADTYGRMWAVTRQDWYNDNLGVLSDVPRLMGRGGSLGLTRAVWVEFMNNAAFFVAGNNNVSSGALSVAGLNAANVVFGKLKGSDGEYLMNRARFLVVPTDLGATARQLWTSTNLAGATNPNAPADNPWAGKFEPVESPYLSDTTITGNSTTAYYLLGDPNDVPVIEVVFLDGIETPTVETAEVDFSQLGVQVRGFWDWGVRKQDPKGGVRSTGV